MRISFVGRAISTRDTGAATVAREPVTAAAATTISGLSAVRVPGVLAIGRERITPPLVRCERLLITPS
jgi:hypothetical protein